LFPAAAELAHGAPGRSIATVGLDDAGVRGAQFARLVARGDCRFGDQRSTHRRPRAPIAERLSKQVLRAHREPGAPGGGVAMRNRRLWFIVVGCLVVALVIGGWSGEAKTRKPRKLRAEIAQLRATVAQLQSDLDFQRRRDAAGGAPGNVVPGGGGGFWPGGVCGDPCAADSDGDGTGDCEDPCPCDPANTDSDGDGAPDCFDPCPDDATDACIDPCRMDSDGDGVTDCDDPCPWDPAAAADGDEDGVADCQDSCPDDPTNECFNPCPLLDQDGDGTRDCNDPCPWGEATGMPCVWKDGDGGARRAGTR
jgi:hypothetical protein